MSLERPSIEYYSFRSVNFERFQALDAVYTLFQALSAIPEKSQEPMVCRQTLQFWQEDIANAYQNRAQLPQVQALQALLPKYDLPQAHWQDLITAIEMEIDRISYVTDDDLRRYTNKKRGSLLNLFACILGAKADLSDMAYFIERVKMLQQHAVPDEERTAFIKKTQSLLPRPTKGKLKSLWVMAMIYSELLQLLAKEPVGANQLIDLSPLAKLFYSYYYRIRC